MKPGAKQPGYPPFAHMPGLVSREDPELHDLMETAHRLPQAATQALLRNVYRAALSYERTGNPDYLTCLASDTLVTMRLHGDPEYEKVINEAPTSPGDSDAAVDVDDMLARRGL